MSPSTLPHPAGDSRYSVTFQDALFVAAQPGQVWRALEQADRLVVGSRWVEQVEMDTLGLVEGSVIDAHIVTPLPFRLKVRMTVESCRRDSAVAVRVEGDLTGLAQLALAPCATGSTVDVQWALEMRHRAMRTMVAMSGPLLRWGHDLVARATIAAFTLRIEGAASGGRLIAGSGTGPPDG